MSLSKDEASSFDQTVASQVDWYHDFSRRCASDADCFAVPGVAASGSIGWCVKQEGRCANVRDLYRSLYTVAAPHHRFLTVPPAFTLPNSDANRSEERLLANLSWYVEWAAEDPRIDGLCPFEYGDGNPAQGLNLGASSLPTLWRALVDLGRTIVAGDPGVISPRALRGSVVSGNIGLQQPDAASPDSDLPPSSKTDDTALVALDDAVAKSPAAGTVDIHWQTVSARTRAIPTVHNPNSYAFQRVNPKTNATNPMHDTIYSRLKALGADHIRYMVRPNAQLREAGSGLKAKRRLGPQQAQDQNGLYNMWASPEPFAPDPRTKTTSWDM